MELIQVRIDEIVEMSGEGECRTLKTVDGCVLASTVEIVYTEPDPIPYASNDEIRPIEPIAYFPSVK